MTTETTCGRCGALLAVDAEFCPSCGMPAAASSPGMPSARSPMDDQALAALRDATLGEYEILSELGRGGMATVYLAHEIALNRKVAIKLVSPHLVAEHTTERFLREARTAAALSHPNLIPIYSVRATDALLFFVMKYIAGPSLETVLKDGKRLPIPVIQTILSEAAAALSYAHRRQIVHRDVKPGNIMIDEDGRVVVTDFGIARHSDSTGLTGTGTSVGTPMYMSPEQCLGDKVSGASDQYSLGVVGYELLAGKLPFPAANAVAMMYAHLHTDATPIGEERADCPPALAAAIMRMMAKSEADRWPSIDEANKAIGALPLAEDDPVRLALTEIARAGASVRRLSLPSTPQSPIATASIARRPPRSMGVPKSGVPSDVAPTVQMTTPADAGAGAIVPARRSNRAWMTAVALVVAVVAIVTWRVAASRSAAETAPANALPSAALPPAAPVVTPPPAPAVPPPAPSISPTTTAKLAPAPAPPAGPKVVAVASVDLAPTTLTVAVGSTGQLRATLRDAGGKVLTDRAIQWSSANPDIADVSTSGRVIATAPGSAQITATAEGRSASATISVAAPVTAAAPPPPAPPAAPAAPADPAPGIRKLVDAYVAAIRGRNVARMVALYPGLPTSTRSLWEKLFDDYPDVTADLAPQTLDIASSGETAAFDVNLTLSNGREHQKILMHFQTNPELASGAWRFRQVVQSYVKQ